MSGGGSYEGVEEEKRVLHQNQMKKNQNQLPRVPSCLSINTSYKKSWEIKLTYLNLIFLFHDLFLDFFIYILLFHLKQQLLTLLDICFWDNNEQLSKTIGKWFKYSLEKNWLDAKRKSCLILGNFSCTARDLLLGCGFYVFNFLENWNDLSFSSRKSIGLLVNRDFTEKKQFLSLHFRWFGVFKANSSNPLILKGP